MRVFVATSKGQGLRENDIFHAIEGELVFPTLEADCNIDAACPCRRVLQSKSGLTSTFRVEEKDITIEDFRRLFDESADWTGRFRGGYHNEFHEDAASQFLTEDIEEFLEPVQKFPPNTVLEKRGDEIYPRIVEHSDAERIQDLIEQGESTTVEFKESFSLCTKKLTKESYMELSSLKTVAGFLNSKGGSLLIGVTNNGDVVGVDREIEKFYKNADGFLLHFKNLLKSKIGESYYPFINHRLVKLDGVFVLLVECENSPTPCYLDAKEFYVRTNPATDKLEGREMVDYINHHWNR